MFDKKKNKVFLLKNIKRYLIFIVVIDTKHYGLQQCKYIFFSNIVFVIAKLIGKKMI
jgi:hypothetical protein